MMPTKKYTQPWQPASSDSLQGGSVNLNSTATSPQLSLSSTQLQNPTDVSINQTPGGTSVASVAPTGGEVLGLQQAPYVDPVAVAAAKEAALVGTRKADIGGKLDAYFNMFQGLFGKMDSAAADQSNETRKNFAGQRTSLTDQYNQEVPGIDMSYYLGGVGDSSLRLAGQGKAEGALKSSIGMVDANEATDLAGIGKEVATARARYQADQNNIAAVRERANASTSSEELLSLQNEIAEKISALGAAEAGYQTGGQYRQDLASKVPARDLSPIRSSLNSLMKGAANPALKLQIAKQIVDNADLGEQQKKELYDQFINAPVA